MTSSLFRAFLSRLFTSVCAIVTAFVSLKLYTIFLTREVYGVIFVATLIMSYLPLAGAGFVGVLNQRILTLRDPDEAAKTSWFAQFLQNCIFLAALVIAVLLMAGYAQTHLVKSSGMPGLLFVCIGVVGAMTFYISGQFSFLIGLGDQTKCYVLQGTLQLLTSLLLYLSFVARLNVWAFPIASGLSALLLFVPLRIILRSHLRDLPLFVVRKEPDYKQRFLAVWRPALDNLMTQVWGLLTFSLDGILVGFLAGAEQAALYGVISRLTYTSRHILLAVGETAWPQLAQQSHPEKNAAFMRKIDRLNAWNVGAWFGAMFATIVPFLSWCLKSDWVAGSSLIAVILIRHAIISLTGPHSFGIISLGLFRDAAMLARREALTSIFFALIFGHFWSTMGIAGGYLAGACLVSGWQFARTYFQAKSQPWVSEWWALYWRFVVAITLSYGLGTLFWRLCQFEGYAPGWMAMIAGGLAFAITWTVTAGVTLWRARRG